jgi:hypothetical protein
MYVSSLCHRAQHRPIIRLLTLYMVIQTRDFLVKKASIAPWPYGQVKLDTNKPTAPPEFESSANITVRLPCIYIYIYSRRPTKKIPFRNGDFLRMPTEPLVFVVFIDLNPSFFCSWTFKRVRDCAVV